MGINIGGWRFAALAVTAFGLGLSCSDGKTANSETEARETLFESALSGQVKPVAELAYQALTRSRRQLTDEQFAVAEKIVRREFGEEKLEHRILTRLADASQNEHLEAVLDWLRSPLGERVSNAWVAASDPATLSAMKSFVEEKNANPPSRRRVELIERFNESALTSEISSNTLLLAALGAAVMVDAIRPADQRIGPEELRASTDARQQLVIPIFNEMSSIVYLLVFRDFSDEELEAVVQFAESDDGRWYYQTTASALVESLLETANGIGETYVAALSKKPAS